LIATVLENVIFPILSLILGKETGLMEQDLANRWISLALEFNFTICETYAPGWI